MLISSIITLAGVLHKNKKEQRNVSCVFPLTGDQTPSQRVTPSLSAGEYSSHSYKTDRHIQEA